MSTNVSTDITLINRFLKRGVEKIYPSEEMLKKKLLSGERLKIYQGFDPTGPYLHIGHAMGIRALRILQQLGHEVIFLVGDFTSKIGDPDKDTARNTLTDEQILKNMEGWKKQAAQLIDFEGSNPVKFLHNYDWLSKLKLEDILQLSSKATVQQMIERDLFDRRIKKNDPVGLHEFLYPLMQGFDSVAMEVDMEIGGTDQTFNMLMGRSLVREYLGKEKFVRTHKMMNAPDGITMSKTKGNGINLGDTSQDIFGKTMSYPDHEIIVGFELLTDVPEDEIQSIKLAIGDGENPMPYKKQLAYEIVKSLRGIKDAEIARNHFERTVQKKDLVDQDMVEIKIEGTQEKLIDILKRCLDSETSNSDIRRTIEQGGVSIDGVVLKNTNEIVELKNGTIIKFGKRKYFKVI